MVVEFLTFEVAADELESWLAVERATWSAYLKTVPGFIRKEYWQEAGDPARVHAVIWWESAAAWRAVTDEEIAAVDESMGESFREATAREFLVLGEA